MQFNSAADQVVDADEIDRRARSTALAPVDLAAAARHQRLTRQLLQPEPEPIAEPEVEALCVASSTSKQEGWQQQKIQEGQDEEEKCPKIGVKQGGALADGALGRSNASSMRQKESLVGLLRDSNLRAVAIETTDVQALRAEVERVSSVVRENVSLAVERGGNLEDLEDKTVELVRLSKRFHMLGRKLSEQEKKKLAATFLQVMLAA
eukprot:COSAG01_NODE_346_length_18524_cov_35.929661_11_plen_207_part_00